MLRGWSSIFWSSKQTPDEKKGENVSPLPVIHGYMLISDGAPHGKFNLDILFRGDFDLSMQKSLKECPRVFGYDYQIYDSVRALVSKKGARIGSVTGQAYILVLGYPAAQVKEAVETGKFHTVIIGALEYLAAYENVVARRTDPLELMIHNPTSSITPPKQDGLPAKLATSHSSFPTITKVF